MMLRRGPARALTVVLSFMAISLCGATADGLSFKVAFSNCQEFVGEGPVALDQAQRFVPQDYVIATTASGQAATVVRITRCEAVKVDGTRAVPTIISQIGVNIVSPDGTGTINNYTLIYATNNPFLAEALDRVGVPASYDPAMTYEYTRNDTGNGGVLYGAVPDANVPAYFLYGPETEPPPNAQQLFIANWWYGTGDRVVRQQTAFPAISFGASHVTLYTSAFSALGQLIGGNAYTNFSILALRGVYPSAEMTVTDSGR
jgi:hypothetical protein